jgi:mono/diheme cytochrome c family protein
VPLRPGASPGTSPFRRRSYGLLLAAAVGLVVWTGDQGGEITHGTTYLTEYMPASLRAWLRLAPARPKPVSIFPAPASATFYAARIAPIFERHCVSCHGPVKVKGGLRLDSYQGLMHGGEDGPVISPWYPRKSDLMRRVTLPPDDDDAMPSGGKKPLSVSEIQLIGEWIAAGASDKEPADAGAGNSPSRRP